jgi:hypothetical protein
MNPLNIMLPSVVILALLVALVVVDGAPTGDN